MTIDFLNMSNGKIKSYLIQNKLALKWTIKKSLTKKSYLLVLSLSLMLDLCGQYRLENIPDSLLIGTNSIILDQYEKVEILNKNKIIHHIKSKSIILNDDEENLTKILVLYDQYSKVENFEVKISDLSGKKIKTIKKKDLQDIAYQDGFSIANDARILFYNIIGIQAPFIIDKEFTIIAEQSFHLPSSSPYEGEKVSIINSLFEILNHDTLNQLTFYNPLGENIDSNFSKGVHTYTLIFQNLDHKYLENKYANKQSSQLRPILTDFSMDNKDGSFKSWKDFGSWIWNLSNETGELSETAKNEIIALLKNEKNERIKLNILYNYLQQNMRYVSVQLGIGGFKPMNVQDVHNFKYGDCKALSNYMMHILKVAGIKSNYILIGAGTGDDLQDISIVRNSFNHAIIAAYPEGDTVFLECTSSITPSGYQGNFTGNRHALLIDEINSKIIKTSVYTETNNVIKNNYDVNTETQKVDHSQTLLGIGIEYKDLLYKIQLPDEKLRDHLIENSSDINELKIKNKKFENQTGYPEIVLTTSFESSKKILSTGSRYFIELNYDKPPVEMIYKKTEENQLNIFNGFTIHDAFNISMPSGCFVEKLPKDFELNYSSGSVAISTTPNPESGKLIYKRSIIYKNGKFGLGKGDDGELLLDAVKKAYSDKIVINCKS
jgi:hypothetical protein